MKWDEIQPEATKWDTIQSSEQPPEEPIIPEQGFMDKVVSYADPVLKMAGLPSASTLESLATVGTGVVAEPVAGLAGMATAPFVGAEEAAKNIAATREALTYKPKSEAAMEKLRNIGRAVETGADVLAYPVGGYMGAQDILRGRGVEQAKETFQDVQDIGISKTLGKQAMEETGSPLLAAAVETAPTALMEFGALKALQKMRAGTRLLDDAGQPTKDLRKALDKEGLSYESLTPEAKKAIPSVADPKLIPRGGEAAKASEKALAAQIKAGGRDDALAGLRVVDDSVVVDKIGKEAVRQGFRPGLVQSVKTASAGSKKKMNQMVNMMRHAKKSERLGLEFRPSDVVGDSVSNRIKFIRDKANSARNELNSIAQTKLAGKSIDATPIINKLQSSLDDLDIRMVGDGVPKPVFKGSLISKDKTSQRVIGDLIDLMSEGGAPDALRAHKLKRQLDIMIDFNKKSAAGLTDAGRNVLKDIRRELNNSVRAVDPDYARVNDVLSQSLDSLGSLDKAVGSIDIFGTGANKALGTRMRALLSNQQGRVKIENALNSIDDVVANLGGKFDDNVKDLVMFSDALDDRFGTMAKTSLAGQTEQAVRQAMDQGVQRSMMQKGAEIIGKGTEKLRGVNDFNAFESMTDLLKR